MMTFLRRLAPLPAIFLLLSTASPRAAEPPRAATQTSGQAERARTPASTTGARVECGSLPSRILGRKVRFCAVLPPTYDSQPARRFPILYWLHGLGQDEQSFVNSGGLALLEDMRREHRLGDFILITPDAGRSFYLNSRDGHNRYEDFFIREFVPGMERRFRIEATRATRGISGVSMGGFGALHYGLKYPELFEAVSAHSAALMEKPPAAFTSGARLGFLEDVFGYPIDTAFWQRNSVFTDARHAPLHEHWRIYFDCGDRDDYGFDEGNRALDRLLTSRGIPHEFHLYPGGHGWSYFARHMPASLAFEWKAFESAARR